MLRVRNSYELELMRKSGQITAQGLKAVIAAVKPGSNLLDLEKIAVQTITSLGGKLSFTTVEDYKWATCLTVNEELVHGIPRDIVLKEGDVLGIDIGALYKGWHTDAAWSVLVSDKSENQKIGKSEESDSLRHPEGTTEGSLANASSNQLSDSSPSAVQNDKRRFLAVGEEALWKAIKQAKAGNKIGDISAEIQSTVEGAGYSVSETLVGHGVGRELHEDPIVPGLGRKGTGLILKKGMTIAIEVIYAEGNAEVVLDPDGWTYVTKDLSTGGLFEMSVIIGANQAEVLTDWRKY